MGFLDLDISDIKKLKFYQVSYREYLTIYDNCIIGVYPFAITIYPIYKIVTYDELKHLEYGHKTQFNHNDFTKKLLINDPCDIFEHVSGRKIHHNESDDDMMYIDHSLDIKSFECEIKSCFRNNKLNLILDATK